MYNFMSNINFGVIYCQMDRFFLISKKLDSGQTISSTLVGV